jgi:hypothetical protein
MTREEIIGQLQDSYKSFTAFVSSLTEKQFLFSPAPDKWTSGQQAKHLLMSIKPLRLALSLPDWFLKIYAGKANRPSKTYEELVEKYKYKLSQGGTASSPYIPKEVPVESQRIITRQIRTNVDKLCKKLERYSEERLDTLILPHPLLGKVTLREMMYFTIHHARHHQNSIEQNLHNK